MTNWTLTIEVNLGEQELSTKEAKKIQKRLGRVVADTLMGARVDGLLETDHEWLLIGAGPTEQIEQDHYEMLKAKFEGKQDDDQA